MIVLGLPCGLLTESVLTGSKYYDDPVCQRRFILSYKDIATLPRRMEQLVYIGQFFDGHCNENDKLVYLMVCLLLL